MFGDWALPRPMWGAYSTPLNPLAVFKGAALRQGRTEKGERGKRERGGITPVTNSWIHHC